MTLPPLLVGGRIERLRSLLVEHDVDALVVHRLVDVRWLTGFTGSAGTVVVAHDEAVLVTDARYRDRAEAELLAAGADARLLIAGHDEQAQRISSLVGRGAVGVDETAVSWAQARRLDADGSGQVVPLPPLVPRLRERKDAAELARMRAAARIADAALAEVRPLLGAGATERDVARALDRAMEDRGADGPGYGTIVASGPNSALPHATPCGRRIERGDLVVIDVGAEVDGYRSDMTRTFVVGAPDTEQQRLLDLVLEAQQAAIARVAVGVSARSIHRAAAEVFAEAGLGDAFLHGVGHGVGLVIHEDPFLARSDSPLEAGHAITVEPGLYLPEVGGVRWEDLLHVGESGVECLTAAPKTPVV
ncbi:MAG: aminopeptidase P family protein [Actinomycetota bacterium]